MAKIKKTGRHTSAVKAARQSVRRALRNRSVKRRIRGLARDIAAAISKKEAPETVQKLMSQVSSAWDKAAKSGVVHWKAAARKKSRLAQMARKALGSAAPAASNL